LTHLCDKNERLVFIDANQRCVEAVCTGGVTADDEFLFTMSGKELDPLYERALALTVRKIVYCVLAR
jgi:hypothetical protein